MLFFLYWPLAVIVLALGWGIFAIENERWGISATTVAIATACAVYFFRDELFVSFNAGTLISYIIAFVVGYFIFGLITGFIYWVYMGIRCRRYIDETEPNTADHITTKYIKKLANAPREFDFPKSAWDKTQADFKQATANYEADVKIFNALKSKITPRIIELHRLYRAFVMFNQRFGDVRLDDRLTDLDRYSSKDDRDNSDIEGFEAKLEQLVSDGLPPRAKQHKKVLLGSAIVWPCTLLNLALYKLLNELWSLAISVFHIFLDKVSAAIMGKTIAIPEKTTN